MKIEKVYIENLDADLRRKISYLGLPQGDLRPSIRTMYKKRDKILPSTSFVVYAREGDVVLGYAGIMWSADKNPWYEEECFELQIYVRANQRRRGIGSAILKRVLEDVQPDDILVYALDNPSFFGIHNTSYIVVGLNKSTIWNGKCNAI